MIQKSININLPQEPLWEKIIIGVVVACVIGLVMWALKKTMGGKKNANI